MQNESDIDRRRLACALLSDLLHQAADRRERRRAVLKVILDNTTRPDIEYAQAVLVNKRAGRVRRMAARQIVLWYKRATKELESRQ